MQTSLPTELPEPAAPSSPGLQTAFQAPGPVWRGNKVDHGGTGPGQESERLVKEGSDHDSAAEVDLRWQGAARVVSE